MIFRQKTHLHLGLFSLSFLLITPTLAEDLVFTEEETREIHPSVNTIMLRCYHHNECPAPITRQDAEKHLGYKASPTVPKVTVDKGACAKLKKHLTENRTKLVDSARSFNLLTTEAQCSAFLKGMAGAGIYEKITK